jgi:hypothetical protein
MPKVTGPLFSLSAKGRFGNVALFSSWLGRPYVKVWSPNRKDSSRRQDAIHSILKRMNHEWMKLSREQRRAWQTFAVKKKPPIPAQSVFLSHAVVAADAGLPVPAIPPKASVIVKPKLKAVRGEDDKSLVLSWSFPISLTPYPLSLLDVWLQISRPSCRAYANHYKHSLYVPASQGSVEMKALPPGRDYHLKARFILPDSSRSPFALISA